MKEITLILLAAGLLLNAGMVQAQALDQRNEFGLGLVLGEPSGINGQFFWNNVSSIDVTAAWSWNDWLMVAADYQRYNYIADSPREWRWYYGLGGYLAFPEEDDDGTLGVRIPLGLKYRFPNTIIDIWAEVDPALELLPDTEPELQGGIGLTFWLK